MLDKTITQKELDALLIDKTKKPIDLSGYNLLGLNFTNANLENAKFDKANMQGVVLDGANLRNASLSGVNLKEASLKNACFQSAILNESTLDEADLTGADFSDGKDWSAKRSDVKKGAFLMTASLKGAKLDGANFTDAALDHADLSKVAAREAIFSYASVAYANLEGSDFSGSKCDYATLFEVRANKSLFENVDFSHADLVDAQFIKAHCANARFNNARIEEAHFEGASLKKASFRDAKCIKAHFEGADMELVSFAHAECQEAHFEGVNASGAFFYQTNMSKAVLAGAIFIEAKCIGADFSDMNGKGMSGQGGNFSDANFQNADIAGAKFDHANLSRTDMRGVHAFGSSVKKADMSDALFQGYETLLLSKKQKKVIKTADTSFIKDYKDFQKPFKQGEWYNPIKDRFSKEEIERAKEDNNRSDGYLTSPVILSPEGVCQGLCSEYTRYHLKRREAGIKIEDGAFIKKLDKKSLETSWWKSPKVSSAVNSYKKAFYEEADKNEGKVSQEKAAGLQKEYLGKYLDGISFATRVQLLQQKTQPRVLKEDFLEPKEHGVDFIPCIGSRNNNNASSSSSSSSSSSHHEKKENTMASLCLEVVETYFLSKAASPILELRVSGESEAHAMVVRAEKEKGGSIQAWHFFDPNFGEFSFSSPDLEHNKEQLGNLLADITGYYHHLLSGTASKPLTVTFIERAEVLAEHVPRIRSSIEKSRSLAIGKSSAHQKQVGVQEPSPEKTFVQKHKDSKDSDHKGRFF